MAEQVGAGGKRDGGRWPCAAAEAEQLADALRRHGNNRTFAAAELGISRVTLYKKLHRYGLM